MVVGLGYPDVLEKYFPTCPRNRWLEDAVRRVERWCVTFFVFFSVCLVCLASVGGLKTSMHQVLVDVILQCQRIIVFYSNVQLFVGVERAILAILAMHWGIHVCIAFSCCNHPSTQYQTIPSQALASAAGRKRC